MINEEKFALTCSKLKKALYKNLEANYIFNNGLERNISNSQVEFNSTNTDIDNNKIDSNDLNNKRNENGNSCLEKDNSINYSLKQIPDKCYKKIIKIYQKLEKLKIIFIKQT